MGVVARQIHRTLDGHDEKRHRNERLRHYYGRRRERQRDAERLVEPFTQQAASAEGHQERHAADHRWQHEGNGDQSA
jgi:hypothetical protein